MLLTFLLILSFQQRSVETTTRRCLRHLAGAMEHAEKIRLRSSHEGYLNAFCQTEGVNRESVAEGKKAAASEARQDESSQQQCIPIMLEEVA